MTLVLRSDTTVRHVVPGDPQRVLSLAGQLLSVAAGFDRTARALSPRSEAWFGPAQQAFAMVLGAYPPVYEVAARAFAAASVACRSHAHELETAQAQARLALRRVDEALALTARWQAQVRERERLVRAAAAGDVAAAAQLATLPALGPDPGAELMRQLMAQVAGAQERVADSARRAAARLREAAKARIPEPHVAVRAVMRAGELGRQVQLGAVEATYDLGVMGATFSPAGLLSDPQECVAGAVSIGAGLKYGVHHPAEFAKALVDADTWSTNPGRALGRLAPDAAITVATGGSAAAARAGAASRRAADAAITLRTFTSADPLVADAANAIEGALPGQIVDVNRHVPMLNGLTREVDIDLGDVVVQVKSGNARKLTRQMSETISSTGLRVVGFAPDILHGAWKNATRQGLHIARTHQELIDRIKEIKGIP